MRPYYIIVPVIIVFCSFFSRQTYAQNDTTKVKTASEDDLSYFDIDHDTLSTAIVQTDYKISRNALSQTYIITDSVRAGTNNALQLFDKLRGISVDFSSDAVRIGQYRDVPVLLNGREVGSDYIKNLNPARIKKIEVLRNPKGKYSAYDIVLDVTLNENYEGYDVAVFGSDDQLFDSGGHWTNVGANMTYTMRKWNIYASASAYHGRAFGADSYKYELLDETTGTLTGEETAAENHRDPNSYSSDSQANASLGADYTIAKGHTLSVQTWHKQLYNKGLHEYNDLSDLLISRSNSGYNGLNSTTGLFYRGNVKNKLILSSDLTYNYYGVRENYDYTRGGITDNDLNYRSRKNYWRFNAQAYYIFNTVWGLQLGYTFTNKDYSSDDRRTGANLFKSAETRHQPYILLQTHPTPDIDLAIGSQFLYDHQDNGLESAGHFSWMPIFKFYWEPIEWLWLSADYYCDVEYPNLDALSTVTSQANSIVWNVGNPYLKPLVMHYTEFYLGFEDIIELNYMIKRSTNDLTPWYEVGNGMVYATQRGSDYLHQYAGIDGDWDIPGNFNINLTLNYQWYKRRLSGTSEWNKGDTYYGDLTLSWTGVKHLRLQGEYFLRYDINPLLQGRQYSSSDALSLTAVATFFKDRLAVTLSYYIPETTLPPRQYTAVTVGPFTYAAYNDSRTWNNQLRLSLRYNIGKGKVTRSRNTNHTESEK